MMILYLCDIGVVCVYFFQNSVISISIKLKKVSVLDYHVTTLTSGYRHGHGPPLLRCMFQLAT